MDRKDLINSAEPLLLPVRIRRAMRIVTGFDIRPDAVHVDVTTPAPMGPPDPMLEFFHGTDDDDSSECTCDDDKLEFYDGDDDDD